jgi:1-acyl-sn-glycerol-3-phosphate acyltransferase
MKNFFFYIVCLWFRKSGWRFIGPLPKTLKNCVIVVGPHHSRKDFFIGLAVCHLAHFRTDILVNEKYFRFPIKNFLHTLGARPYNHDEHPRLHKWVLKNIKKRQQYSVVMTTRFLSDDRGTFRSEWYEIALTAGIPIVPVAIDHRKKSVKIHSHFYTSLSKERDLHFVQNFIMSFE